MILDVTVTAVLNAVFDWIVDNDPCADLTRRTIAFHLRRAHQNDTVADVIGVPRPTMPLREVDPA